MYQPSYMMRLDGSMGGITDWFQDKTQDLVDTYIDDPLRDLGNSVGLSDEEIDRIAAETNKAYQQELKNQQQNLINQITGHTGQPAPQISTIDQLQNQIANLRNQLAASVPGGMTTVYAAGGLIGGFVLYKIFAGPKG